MANDAKKVATLHSMNRGASFISNFPFSSKFVCREFLTIAMVLANPLCCGNTQNFRAQFVTACACLGVNAMIPR
jgi:hypothetical protein